MTEHIFGSLVLMLTPTNILLMLLGVTGGMMAGALPGLTATMSIALLVPFTFTLPPVSGLVTLGAIYCGAIFGGAFAAILVNTPGTPSSIGTTFDGYPLTKKGKGEEAVWAAALSSASGGIIGTVILLFLAPPLAIVALRFGAPEYFWVSMFGLTIISSITGSLIKGLAGALFGLLISTIGISPVGGDTRFIFGLSALQGGVEIIPALIGMFCIPELINMVGTGLTASELENAKLDDDISSLTKLKETFIYVIKKPIIIIKSAVIGAFVGIIPGAGGNIANLVAYNEAKRSSDYSEKFGTGILDGIIATESANNATIEGGLVPLLTLGVPGTPPSAVIFGALMLQGLRPGPELFTEHAELTYAFILSFFVANLLMFGIGLLGGKTFYTIINKLTLKTLVPGILFLTILGSFAIRSNIMDVYVMIILGLIAYFLKELGFHPGPIVLGIILGPIAEEGLVQGYMMGTPPHEWTIFFTRPLSLLLFVLTMVSAFGPLIKGQIKTRFSPDKQER